ncbi:hypothetical protein [Bacillus swezeyi]|uniref:hypothetical protein n=1 Tax=Bacillus swezeyi TaxID=1925020 RepID=UPI0016537E7A|nr:hypothetical protein [Bacillus swezeyi]
MKYNPLHCPYPRWQWQGGTSVLLKPPFPSILPVRCQRWGIRSNERLIQLHLEGGR